MASIYPSGERPQECPDRHAWIGGNESMLVGTSNCNCPGAMRNFRIHVWVRCRGNGDKCAWGWNDFPCEHLPRHEGDWPGFHQVREVPDPAVPERCIWVSLPHATFGLVVRSGRITDAPPIARWTLGKDERYVAGYYRSRGAQFADTAGPAR